MIAELTPEEWLAGMEKKIAAVAALVQLVDSSTLGRPPCVGRLWMSLAFRTSRSGMASGGDDRVFRREGIR